MTDIKPGWEVGDGGRECGAPRLGVGGWWGLMGWW